MKFACVLLLVAVASLNGGCAIIDKEEHNRGGYLDYLADGVWLKADSKKMRALRALAIEASLARIASVAPKNDIDRRLLAQRIGATSERARFVIRCAFLENPLTHKSPNDDPCFYFDSLMVDYSTGLFDLALVALPVEDGRRLINAVGGNILNPLNVGEVIDSLITLGKDALKYGRLAGALYRDTQEMEVQIWLQSPGEDQSSIPAQFRITDKTVAALAMVYHRQTDDMIGWREQIDALRARGLEPVPSYKFVSQLGGIIDYLCGLITQDPKALNACVWPPDAITPQPELKSKVTRNDKSYFSRMTSDVRSPVRTIRKQPLSILSLRQ